MIWAFTGYAIVIYVSCVTALLADRAGTRAFDFDPLVMTVGLPGFAIGVGGSAWWVATRTERERVRLAMTRGLVRRVHVLATGALAGAASVAVAAGIFYTSAFGTEAPVIYAFGGVAAVGLPSAVGCGWLTATARKVLERDRGFPVTAAPRDTVAGPPGGDDVKGS